MFQGPLRNTDAAEKAAHLLIWVGEEGREICRSWNLTAEERKKYHILIARFRDHVAPKGNKIFARYLFQNRSQKQGESFEKFATYLRNMVNECEYQEPEAGLSVESHLKKLEKNS